MISTNDCFGLYGGEIMILTVVTNYPNEKERYNNGFVHSRVKAYLREGIEAKVFIIGMKASEAYTYEGVTVMCGSSSDLARLVNEESEISCVAFHFLNIQMFKALKKFRPDVSAVLFCHGNEALWWYERIFPDTFADIIRILKFIKYAFINTRSIFYIRHRINRIKINTSIICVSKWMRRVVIKNWRVNPNKIKAYVIPNVVDETVFPYVKKTPDQRFKVLMIRSFTNGKYALDIAAEIIKEVEKRHEGVNVDFTVVGDGWLHDKYTKDLKKYPNIRFVKKFLSQDEIREFHGENGIFICPTRQDAQGVSMCEAMSSGLVPIASNNTAIPEFLPIEFGLTFDKAVDAADRIVDLLKDEDEFMRLSSELSEFIKEKCGVNATTLKEIRLMKSLERRSKK